MAVSPSLPTATLTACAVSKRVVPTMVAVTVMGVWPALSAMLAGLTESVTSVTAASSLVSLMAVPATVTPVSSPSTEMVSSASWNASFVGVSVNSTVALRCPAGISISWSSTAV